MRIRAARAADAEEGSTLLRRSIEDLCRADHGDDPARIAAWTANKTAAMWLAWLDQADIRLFVAVDERRILGVGMIRTDGHIMLNYVLPEARFQGVSKAMIARLEAEAMKLGSECCTLETSETARRFYQGVGYAPAPDGGAAMRKPLGPLDSAQEGDGG